MVVLFNRLVPIFNTYSSDFLFEKATVHRHALDMEPVHEFLGVSGLQTNLCRLLRAISTGNIPKKS